MMTYVSLRWKHIDTDCPAVMLMELDATRREHRRVEIWPKGRTRYTDEATEVGDKLLGLKPWPDLDMIAADPEFELHYITREDFERACAKAQERDWVRCRRNRTGS